MPVQLNFGHGFGVSVLKTALIAASPIVGLGSKPPPNVAALAEFAAATALSCKFESKISSNGVTSTSLPFVTGPVAVHGGFVFLLLRGILACQRAW
jgi:hypothetical protein